MTTLDSIDWRVIKEINIVSESAQGNEIVIGYIIYERLLSDSYKVKKDTEADNNKMFLSPLKQELFPEDDLERVIQKAVTERFEKSFVKNHLFLFDTDITRFNHILNRPKEICKIEVKPNPESIGIENIRKKIRSLNKDINIFQNYTHESIKDLIFIVECEYGEHEKLFNQLSNINFF